MALLTDLGSFCTESTGPCRDVALAALGARTSRVAPG